MSLFTMLLGIIGAIVIISLIVAGYTGVMGSVANDASVNDVRNSSHNTSYEVGTGTAQGFMGLDMGIVFVMFIIAIIIAAILIFRL